MRIALELEEPVNRSVQGAAAFGMRQDQLAGENAELLVGAVVVGQSDVRELKGVTPLEYRPVGCEEAGECVAELLKLMGRARQVVVRLADVIIAHRPQAIFGGDQFGEVRETTLALNLGAPRHESTQRMDRLR